MKNWKSLLAVSALSVGLVGCTPAMNNNAQNGTTNQYGTNSVQNTNDYWANANLNDQNQANPKNYIQNSVMRDGNYGTLSHGAPHTRDFGYATYNKRDMHLQQASTFYLDRNVLARAVGTVVTSLPGVEKSSVLATDEDLFIGVPGVKNNSTLNKVKLSAWSMTPRYYKVYVSNDQKTIDEVQSLVANTKTKLDHRKLEKILKKHSVDMTGTNVTDNGQNKTNYQMERVFPNTNGTHR